MKVVFVGLADRLYAILIRTLVHIFFGPSHQKKTGWRGKYATMMASNAKKLLKKGLFHNAEVRQRLRRVSNNSFQTIWCSYDYYLCHVLLGSEINDWFAFHFYEKSWRYKKKCMTFWRNKFFNDTVNEREHRLTDILDDKTLFASHWNSYLGRKWCVMNGPHGVSKDEFLSLFKGDRVVIKFANGWGGTEFRTFDKDHLESAFLYASENRNILIAEQYLYQSGVLHELNPTSLNTIRVCTLMKNGNPMVLFAKLRVGGKGAVVDNACAGGSLFNVDIDTGTLIDGTNYKGEEIKTLPTGIPVKCFTIPHWEDVKEYCKEAHMHAPKNINLVGWDVCLSDNNLCIIEGNANPAGAASICGIPNPWKFAKQYLDDLECCSVEIEKLR